MKYIFFIIFLAPFISFSQETNIKLTPYQIDTIWLNNLKNETNKNVQIQKIKERIIKDSLYNIYNNNRIDIAYSDSLIYYYACETIVEKRKYPNTDLYNSSDTAKWVCGDKFFVVLKYKKGEYRLDMQINSATSEILRKINSENIDKIEFLSLNQTIMKYGTYVTLPSIYGTIVLITNDKKFKKYMKKKYFRKELCLTLPMPNVGKGCR
jgi:hypothetical protein